jgi:outer membrane lipoprotein carrier protein
MPMHRFDTPAFDRRPLTRRAALQASLAAVMLGALDAGASSAAAPDAVQQLRQFLRDSKSGIGQFTQTVTAPGATRPRVSTGTFEFVRPDRFRFSYTRPYEQHLIADGHRLWNHDPDLNQVTSRAQAQALSGTPAAILAGSAPDRDFVLASEPAKAGVAWVVATPRTSDGGIRSVRIGLREGALVAVEIVDGFGQRSLLEFSRFEVNAPVAAERFRFTPPPGSDVITQ